LRAAELHPFGMVGFGWVYRAFRRGLLQDDDEVCVVHAVPELNFEPLSDAMVNIRYSLGRMRRRGQISRESERRIVAAVKELHFSKRNEPAIRSAFEQELGAAGAAAFDLYESTKVDIKTRDAEQMLAAAAAGRIKSTVAGWSFPLTNHWLTQFLVQRGDIPPIARWHPAAEKV
jgi:hypothetical protein